MTGERVQRRLAAILAADVVGYSRLIGRDEAGTRARFNDQFGEVIEPAIGEHRGRLVKTMGDGFLVEFGSVVDAVQCATDIQNGVAARQNSESDDRKILFRLGLHLGDVIVEGEDIHGDGVNIAARLEELAEPGGICVSDLVHAGVRNKLSLDFIDLGEQSLKNIADPLQVFRIALDTTTKIGTADSEALFRCPAVAVLPFENLSGDPEQEYFADGLTEDIITALSLWKAFPVIARNSTFAYKGRSLDIRRTGEELGARYVIEGSVRKAGNRVRVTAQLINAESGHHVWAERFDRDLDDIFDLQDELTNRIAYTVVPHLELNEAKHSTASHTHGHDSWDLVQRGMAFLNELTTDGNARARELFERAIVLDPDFSRAYTGLAYSHHRDMLFQTSEARDKKLLALLEAARRGVKLDEHDSFAQMELGIALVFAEQFEEAIGQFERAIVLNPSNAIAHAGLGQAMTLLGRPDEAIPYLERAFRINPQDPRNHIYFAFMARAHLTARRYEEAVGWSRDAAQRHSKNPEPHLLLAAALGHLGRQEEARAELDTCFDLDPGYAKPSAWAHAYRNASDTEHLLDGLRNAGWEG